MNWCTIIIELKLTEDDTILINYHFFEFFHFSFHGIIKNWCYTNFMTKVNVPTREHFWRSNCDIIYFSWHRGFIYHFSNLQNYLTSQLYYFIWLQCILQRSQNQSNFNHNNYLQLFLLLEMKNKFVRVIISSVQRVKLRAESMQRSD